MESNNRAILGNIVSRFGTGQSSLVPILLGIQDEFGYLPVEMLNLIPEMTSISASAIRGVATYYSHFRLRPAGKHSIKVCIGTACYVKGAEQTYQAFRKKLDVAEDDDTDPDRIFTISKVACLGCCMLAPAVQIDDLIYGWVSPAETERVMHEFLKCADQKRVLPKIDSAADPAGEVKICLCSSCAASGANEVYYHLLKWSADSKIAVKSTSTGCTGLSFHAPVIKVTDRKGQSFYYGKMNADNVQAVLLQHFSPRSVRAHVERLIYMTVDPAKNYLINQDQKDKVWLSNDNRIVMDKCMEQPPCDLQIYKESGGFKGFDEARNLKPTQIIAQIQNSGLRGRGGAGFPTGKKWEIAANSTGKKKFVICNADEGDPGAFMDRMLLESVPFRIIEGMMTAGLAIGAESGFIFVRKEYPLAVQRIREAISICIEDGLLKSHAGAEKGSLNLEVVEGAGAFVCGEETALIAAIEGERGIPRERPPFPAEKGLYGMPTLINNVETFASVAWIMQHGPEAFKKKGTASSPGTKTFALAGKIERGGLIEVPMGISIRQVIEEYGGGVSGNAALKAVQIGGPSGGCLPESLFDLPIDYEALAESGAIMGSGGLVVLNEHDCMVDIARYFLEFTASESCGKCTFCRIGSLRMLEILNRLRDGKGNEDDIDKLESLAHLVKNGSRCGLGRTAPNPVLTTLRYFRDEYEKHARGFCPAGSCTELFRFHIGTKCIGCMLCARDCPVEAISFTPWKQTEIDQEKCVRCGVCRALCPEAAIEVCNRKDSSEKAKVEKVSAESAESTETGTVA